MSATPPAANTATLPFGMPVEGAPGWYCLSCGDQASYQGSSLDPAHPMVTCLHGRNDPRGRARSCGIVPGTRDPIEAGRLIYQAKCERATLNHQRNHGHKTDAEARRCRICSPSLTTGADHA